jgi:hypothetical protein
LLIGAGAPVGTSYSYPVSVGVSAGVDGGSVFNTAYLDGEDIYVPLQIGRTPIYNEFGVVIGYDPVYYYAMCCEGIQKEASSEVVVKARDTGGDDPTLLKDGDFSTFDQSGYQNKGKPQGYLILLANWSTVYPPGTVSVGDHFKMTFTSAEAIGIYLPDEKTAKEGDVLTANLTNPTSTSSKDFGGHVLALRLNVDCSAAGIMPVGFGNVLLANLVDGSYNGSLKLTAAQAAALNGHTIGEILADAEHVLGGDGAVSTYGLGINELRDLARLLNISCKFGNVSPFAALYLRKQ